MNSSSFSIPFPLYYILHQDHKPRNPIPPVLLSTISSIPTAIMKLSWIAVLSLSSFAAARLHYQNSHMIEEYNHECDQGYLYCGSELIKESKSHGFDHLRGRDLIRSRLEPKDSFQLGSTWRRRRWKP